MREYIVTIFGEEFEVDAPNFQRARWIGCKLYLRKHPMSKYKVTTLVFSGKAKARVAEDRRKVWW